MGSRAVKGWGQLALQLVLLLLIVGGLQVVSERRTRRFDLTPTRSFSLSDITKQVLADVAQPLRITVFYQRGRRELHKDLLERLQLAQPQLAFELYDFDRFPDKAKVMGVTQPGRVAIEYGDRRAVVEGYPEPLLVSGILRVLRGDRRRIGFTSGHGERATAGGYEALGRFSQGLDVENYEPFPVNLLDGSVPEHVEMLIVAGPRSDFLSAEVDAVRDYLKRGRGVLFLLEPGPLPNLRFLLATMGIQLGDDFIVEKDRRIVGTDGLAAVVERFKPGNPVAFPQGRAIDMGAVLPSARSVDVFAEVPGVRAESIAITGDGAWIMADPDRARRGEEPSKAHADREGPASVMVMAQVGDGSGEGGTGQPGRVVVVGDADFASDGYIDLLGNRDLALNAVAWVAGEAAVAGERSKALAEVFRPLSPMVLTEATSRRILALVAVVQPLAVVLLGSFIVWRRRRHG